jgi:hypothetical protein
MRKVIATLDLVVAIFAAKEAGMAHTEVTGPSENYPNRQCARPSVKLIKPEFSHTGNANGSVAVRSYNSCIKQYGGF